MQVQWLSAGTVALSYCETGRNTVVFELTPKQAASLAAQLLAPSGVAGADCQAVTQVVAGDGGAQVVIGVDVMVK